MKLPRDIDAGTLIKALQRIGYRVLRQSGSHIRLFAEQPSPHALTVPAHWPLKIGTPAAILVGCRGTAWADARSPHASVVGCVTNGLQKLNRA